MNTSNVVDWPAEIHSVLTRLEISLVAYVPDAGHRRLIELCIASEGMRTVPLTSEEEGIGLLAGAWLGHRRGILLMQSSGVGNCVNAIASITQACAFPLLMLVAMRGEEGEKNPWQIPMGRTTAPVFRALGVSVARADDAGSVGLTVDAMARRAFDGNAAVGVLLTQRLIGIKSFGK